MTNTYHHGSVFFCSASQYLRAIKVHVQLEYAPYSLGSSASVHLATKSASTCDLMAHRGLYIMSNGRSSIAHLAIRPHGVAVVYYIVEWYFRGHRD